MTIPSLFLLRAGWGTREESAAELTHRISSLLAVFSSARGSLANRFWSTELQPVTGDRRVLDHLVDQGYERNVETGRPVRNSAAYVPETGHRPMASSPAARIFGCECIFESALNHGISATPLSRAVRG